MTRDELAKRIAETSLLRGSFTLRSGRNSSFYLDKYLFSTQPKILSELGHLFAGKLPRKTTLLAGAELGGIPLVSAASLASGLPCIFVRSSKKEYGTAKQVEGVMNADDNVVIIEDVVTSGGQVVEAAKIIQQAGASILKIIATIDRLEGGGKAIEAAGFAYESLFTVRDLGITNDG